ncbi:hypothetical protein OAL15_04110, partial [Flavobacteriales bacterium]|nr:hypothetical protein [Flavobacteriales bacterium]
LTEIDSTKFKVDGVNLQSTLYKNVFTEWQERINLPTVSKHFVLKSSSRVSSERLMTLENGQSFLSSFTKGKGRSFVLTSALKDDWTNFHRHALFVPTLYNIALNSVTNGVSKEIIGSNDMIATKSRADKSEVLEVENLATESFFVPERISRPEGTGIVVHNQIKEDGQYLLRSQEGDTIQPLSFNFNRDESDMNFLTPTEFKESILSFGAHRLEIIYGKAETIKSQVQELHDGKQLWRWFLLLALVCLLFETILIRIL